MHKRMIEIHPTIKLIRGKEVVKTLLDKPSNALGKTIGPTSLSTNWDFVIVMHILADSCFIWIIHHTNDDTISIQYALTQIFQKTCQNELILFFLLGIKLKTYNYCHTISIFECIKYFSNKSKIIFDKFWKMYPHFVRAGASIDLFQDIGSTFSQKCLSLKNSFF